LKKGITLVELLTTSIIIAFVLTGIGIVMSFSTNMVYEGVTEATAQANLRRIINMINEDVKSGRTLSGDLKSLQIINGTDIIKYLISNDGKLYRNDAEVLIIGANTSIISGDFNHVDSNTVDVSGITGKYYSLNFEMNLTIKDDVGREFKSGTFAAYSNCRNLPF